MSARGTNSLGKATVISGQYRSVVPQIKQNHGNDVVEINVGGVIFSTKYQTLATSNSPYFEAIFSIAYNGRIVENPGAVTKDKSNRIFIDRDGKLFRHILQYMRDGKHTVLPQDPSYLKMLKREADFFGLHGLRELIEKNIFEHERQPSAYLMQQKQQMSATDEMIHLLQKLSQQLSANAFSQQNGYRR